MMNPEWWNNYTGIPFAAGGSSFRGCDCWGLVRLVHRHVFGRDLIAPEDAPEARSAVQGLMLATRDAFWTEISSGEEQPGDVCLYRVRGFESHVGVVTRPGWMLHVPEGGTSGNEPYVTGRWADRLSGIYRYKGEEAVLLAAPERGIRLLGCPNPVRMERIDEVLPPGGTLEEIINTACDRAGVPQALRAYGHAYIDTTYYGREMWRHVMPRDGQVVNFRIVPGGGNAIKMGLMIAVMVAAIVVSIYFPPAIGLVGVAASIVGGLAGAAVTIAGTLLVNALFPTPTPKLGGGAGGQTDRREMHFLSGSNNALRPGEPIPIVLGTIRMTPDHAGKPYTRRLSETQTSLVQCLCYGYGPLAISDTRNGDSLLSRYQDITINTYQGYPDDPALSIFTQDMTETALNITMRREDNPYVSDWYYQTTPDDTDRIINEYYFPDGCWSRSEKSGKYYAARVRIRQQVRQLPSGAWQDTHIAVAPSKTRLTSCPALTYFEPQSNGTVTEREIPLWRWSVFSLDKDNCIVRRDGTVTDSKGKEPSAKLLAQLAQGKYQWNDTSYQQRLPGIGENEEMLYYVCVHENAIVDVVDKRDSVSVTGVTASYSGMDLTLSAGEIQRGWDATLRVDVEDGKKKLNPFTRHIVTDVTRGKYEIRSRREGPNYTSANWKRYNSVQWRVMRCRTNGKPIRPQKPVGTVEFEVRASNQINGALEAINSLVKSIVKDYNYKTKSWQERVSNNPAALFVRVLQGPAKAVSEPDSKIDWPMMEHWHDYCRKNGFTFNHIYGADSMTSVYDVLKDIAAAGRAVPYKVDDRWTVIIDEPRPDIVQHFCPHNIRNLSWRRENVDMPHAIVAKFLNEEKGYQEDTVTVYADGYGPSNATKFENWDRDRLRGRTNPRHAYKDVRYAQAHAILRPKKYTFTTDMGEHFICTMGDRVYMLHEMLMIGLGSGRVKRVIMQGNAAVGLVLDNPVQMEGGKEYGLRVRLGSQKGKQLFLTLDRAPDNAFYGEVSFPAIAKDIPEPGDLFLFGEGADYLVETIAPNKGDDSASLTLVDYSPAIYGIDDGPIPAFESSITIPPALPNTQINSVPIFVSAWSDERALEVLPDGTLISRIGVASRLPDNAEGIIDGIQARWRVYGDDDWTVGNITDLGNECVLCGPVDDGARYDVELRYVAGPIIGPWARMLNNYLVVGKTLPPPDILWLAVENKRLFWPVENMPLDVINGGGYEVRVGYGEVRSWGKLTRIRDGYVTDGHLDISNYIDGIQRTFAVKALDSGGRLSNGAAFFVTAQFLDSTAPEPDNVVYEQDQAALGWSGVLTGGHISGTSIAADDQSFFYPQAEGGGIAPAMPFWPQTPAGAIDGDALVWLSAYADMTYEFTWMPPMDLVGENLGIIVVEAGGQLLSVEYAVNNDAMFYPQTDEGGADMEALFWPQREDEGGIDLAAIVFLFSGEFFPVPESIRVIEDTAYVFRVRFLGGASQAVCQALSVYIDMPDIRRDVLNVPVPVAGARLPIGAGWRAVKFVNLDVLADGGNAVYARALDMSAEGPLVACYDIQGNPTPGTVNAVPVVGY